MLSQFHKSYQRVEQSLQRLTDSIAAYNPSTSAAEELAAADDAVNLDLEQLVIHQTNHQRILALRRTAETLDDTLQTTIKLLADTRKDILAVSSNTRAENQTRQVQVDDLLAYAKFISKTTVPPTFRKQDLPPPPTTSTAKTHITNGFATPPPAAQENDIHATTDDTATKAMREEDKRWLNPLENLPFEPWPSHDVIQRGALADIQRMVEAGKDPAAVLTAEEQAEVDRRKMVEEEREREAQAERERRRMSLFDTPALRRRETMGDVFNPDDL